MHGELSQNRYFPTTDVRCRELGSEESTREEVGCGENENVMLDEWSQQTGKSYE